MMLNTSADDLTYLDYVGILTWIEYDKTKIYFPTNVYVMFMKIASFELYLSIYIAKIIQ